MYPLAGDRLYPRNAWYVAAWTSELSAGLLGRVILGTPVVLFRNAAGEVVAFDDRCPHRKFPLSKGYLDGDALVCSYHGFGFAGDGRCVRLPTNDRISAPQKVKTYPVKEMWNWVWIWLGDPSQADPALIPDHAHVHDGDSGWAFVEGGRVALKARHMLLHDNLLDLSHLTFLHRNTIGSSGIASARLRIEPRPFGLEMLREVKSDHVEETPLGRAIGVKGPVDRIMAQQFFAPSLHVTGPEFRSAEHDGVDPGRVFGAFRVIHAITPESPTTTHYFWGFTRNFRTEPEFTDTLLRPITAALVEDVDAVEEVERLLGQAGPGFEEIHSSADAAALRGRRLIQQMIDRETAPQLELAD